MDTLNLEKLALQPDKPTSDSLVRKRMHLKFSNPNLFLNQIIAESIYLE